MTTSGTTPGEACPCCLQAQEDTKAAVAKALADPLALIRDLVFWATHTPSGGEYRKKREVLEAAELLVAGKGDTHDDS